MRRLGAQAPGAVRALPVRAHFFGEKSMWKIIVGFIAFAALALYVLSKGGDIDMGGEKHGIETPAAAEAPASETSTPK